MSVLRMWNGTAWVDVGTMSNPVTQIVAGTGITISPTSGVGAVTITSSASAPTYASTAKFGTD